MVDQRVGDRWSRAGQTRADARRNRAADRHIKGDSDTHSERIQKAAGDRTQRLDAGAEEQTGPGKFGRCITEPTRKDLLQDGILGFSVWGILRRRRWWKKGFSIRSKSSAGRR